MQCQGPWYGLHPWQTALRARPHEETKWKAPAKSRLWFCAIEAQSLAQRGPMSRRCLNICQGRWRLRKALARTLLSWVAQVLTSGRPARPQALCQSLTCPTKVLAQGTYSLEGKHLWSHFTQPLREQPWLLFIKSKRDVQWHLFLSFFGAETLCRSLIANLTLPTSLLVVSLVWKNPAHSQRVSRH